MTPKITVSTYRYLYSIQPRSTFSCVSGEEHTIETEQTVFLDCFVVKQYYFYIRFIGGTLLQEINYSGHKWDSNPGPCR